MPIAQRERADDAVLQLTVGQTLEVGSVVAVLRYPLKSAQGERLQSVAVDPEGLRGDRAWACVDLSDGTVGSAKHPRRWGRLLEVTARVDDRDGTGCVLIEVAGRQQAAGSAEADAAVSEHLGRAVRLTAVVPEQARLHRQLPDDQGMVPEWMSDTTAGQEMVTEVSGALPGGRFVDFGAVHLVTTGALAALARQVGRAHVDALRFRPNIVLDAPHDPEPGRELRIGELVLRVVLPTPRCVVPGLSPDHTAPMDRQLLGVLARHHRTAVGDLGVAACFGVYAEVLHPGPLELGQRVQ